MGNIIRLPRRPRHSRNYADIVAPMPAALDRQDAHRALVARRDTTTIGFAEIVDRLGWQGEGVEQRQMLARLRILHERCGMPAPRGLRLRAGRILVGGAAITQRSQWDRFEFLRWLDNSLPDAIAPAAPTCASRAQRAAAARRIAGGCAA